MPDFYYPPLDDATLKALKTIGPIIRENPAAYFADSPYSEEKDQFLRHLFVTSTALQAAAASVLPPVGDEEQQYDDQGQPILKPVFEGLRVELIAAYLYLKGAKNDKNQDKVGWAKGAVPLLEKIAKLDALSANISQVGAFQKAVIELMEEVCTPEQRVKIMARLSEMLIPDTAQVSTILNDSEDLN